MDRSAYVLKDKNSDVVNNINLVTSWHHSIESAENEISSLKEVLRDTDFEVVKVSDYLNRKFKFSEILELMKIGFAFRVKRLSSNYLFMENNSIFVNDGMYDIPVGSINSDYILAEDWEIV